MQGSMFDSRGILDSPGKIITIISSVFVLVVLLGFLATLAGSQGVANACSVVNQPGSGFICVSEADASVFYRRDGSVALTGDMPVAGFSLLNTGSVVFQDALGNPATNGELQRNGANLLYYDGTNARSFLHQAMTSGQCAGFVIASDAPAALRAAGVQVGYDYGSAVQVADGTDDDVTVQAVIDAVNGQGKVCASAGNFDMANATPITLPVGDDGGGLLGAGKGGWELPTQNNITVLDFTNATSDILVTMGATGSRVWNTSISNLAMKGNSTSTYGLRVAGGLNVVEDVLFDNFDTAGGSVIVVEESSAQNLFRRNTYSNNASTIFTILYASGQDILEDSYFWANTGNPMIVLGDPAFTTKEAPINTQIRNNLFDSNVAAPAVGIAVNWCEDCVIANNNWAGQSADAATTVAIRVGYTSATKTLKSLKITDNAFLCRANDIGTVGWNSAITFTQYAIADAVILSGNEFDRCKVAGVNNTSVTPTAGNALWIYDLGNRVTTTRTGDGQIAGSGSMFTVDGVAGGVITPQTREATLGDLFTASASGSQVWSILPRSSDTTATADAGLNGFNVTWREDTTTKSIQAWDDRPVALGNGIVPVFKSSDRNNGTAADNAFFSLTSGGADISATWLSLVKLPSNTAGAKTLLSKYNDQADQCEWLLDISGTETVRMFIYDNDASANCATFIEKSSSTSLTVGQWYLIAATYDGSATAAGINVYALSLASITTIGDTNGGAGSYATADNTTATVLIGAYTGATGLANGGPCDCNIAYSGFLPGIAMSRAELLQAAYALMPYAGVQLGR